MKPRPIWLARHADALYHTSARDTAPRERPQSRAARREHKGGIRGARLPMTIKRASASAPPTLRLSSLTRYQRSDDCASLRAVDAAARHWPLAFRADARNMSSAMPAGQLRPPCLSAMSFASTLCTERRAMTLCYHAYWPNFSRLYRASGYQGISSMLPTDKAARPAERLPERRYKCHDLKGGTRHFYMLSPRKQRASFAASLVEQFSRDTTSAGRLLS